MRSQSPAGSAGQARGGEGGGGAARQRQGGGGTKKGEGRVQWLGTGHEQCGRGMCSGDGACAVGGVLNQGIGQQPVSACNQGVRRAGSGAASITLYPVPCTNARVHRWHRPSVSGEAYAHATACASAHAPACASAHAPVPVPVPAQNLDPTPYAPYEYTLPYTPDPTPHPAHLTLDA